MRIPKSPPDWREILSSIAEPGRLSEILSASHGESTRPDRYLHWDELPHRPASGIASLEERWAGLKLSRVSRHQPISLQDPAGAPFTFFVTQRMFELLHDIDLRCGGTVSIPHEVANPYTRDRYYVSSLIQEALTSSQLEGAVVTRAEAKELLRTKRKPATRHERIVLNNFLTMQQLRDLKNQDLSPESICEVHRRITTGTLDDETDEGRLRTKADDVRVEDEESGEVMHVPPPAAQLPDRLEKLCAFANDRTMTGFLHPVIRSILLHFWLAYDHPFVDGNGRAARALFYWSMLRHGFWLFEFISISHVILRAPRKYYRSFFYTETDENDLNYFLIHQLKTISQSIGDLHDYIISKRRELDELQSILKPGTGLNHRQLALLKHALKHPDCSYTVQSHGTSHGVVSETARTDLEALVRRGYLLRRKVSKAFHYYAPEDLTDRLKRA